MVTTDKIEQKEQYNIWDWIKRDWYVILICALALFACVFTILSVEAYQNKVNEHWISQWDDVCNVDQDVYIPIKANITFDLLGEYNDEDIESLG